jgi:hypothetical protein
MSKKRKLRKELADKRRIAERTQQKLALLIIFLLAIDFILMFRIGESFWFGWMIEHRTRNIGLMLFATIIVTLLSPLLIEVESNSRPLSGPGKRPMGSGWGG